MYKNQSTSSRLQRIEERRNHQQAWIFVLLSIGFLLVLIFVGFPLFVKAAVFFGDMRSSSQAIDAKDSTAPITPKISVDYEATSSAKINIKGFSEPGTTVTLIKNNDKGVEVVADADGNFVFEKVKLMGGENRFQAVSVDSSGNKSPESDVTTVTFDDQPPELTITSPTDGQTFYEDSREIVVAGKTDKDANVKVNDYVVVVDNEGNYAKKLQLNEGENEIKVTANDNAGNVTQKSIKVNYSR